MDILYVFAHPDDESFGPQLAMLRQIDAGHEVHLLVLTRGGDSRLREGLGVTRREFQEVRARELTAAATAIGCRSLRIGAFPDGGLQRIDPRVIERPLRASLEVLDPQVVVTFPHHGINGHGDHCATHAATTLAFCTWRETVSGPRRLAFIGLEAAVAAPIDSLHGVSEHDVAWRIPVDAELLARAERTLDAHVSQLPVIAEYRPLAWFDAGLVGTLFDEQPLEPLADLTAGL